MSSETNQPAPRSGSLDAHSKPNTGAGYKDTDMDAVLYFLSWDPLPESL